MAASIWKGVILKMEKSYKVLRPDKDGYVAESWKKEKKKEARWEVLQVETHQTKTCNTNHQMLHLTAFMMSDYII